MGAQTIPVAPDPIYDPSQLTLAGSQATVRRHAQAMADFVNHQNQKRLDTQMLDRNANMESGVGPNSVAPPIPIGSILTVVFEPSDTEFGYASWGDDPKGRRLVSSVTPDILNLGSIPVAHPPQMVIHLGNQIGNTKWYSIGPDDTFPLGMTTPPQPDGHVYERVGSAMGTNVATGINTGWYLQVG